MFIILLILNVRLEEKPYYGNVGNYLNHLMINNLYRFFNFVNNILKSNTISVGLKMDDNNRFYQKR